MEEKFTRHPFSIPENNTVYYSDMIPVELLKQTMPEPKGKEKLQELVKDIQENGIKTPLILCVSTDKNLDVILGNKRLFAAKTLGYTHLRGIINVGTGDSTEKGDTVLARVIKASKRLLNSDDVIVVFGGPEAVDVEHLCIDQKGRLFSVAADHLQWTTCKEAANPEEWCQKTCCQK